MWSPKKNNNGAYSQYYQNMTVVQPGDVVLSYAGGEVRAVGIAINSAYESPKPTEFGLAGSTWSDLGWRVDVQFNELPPAHRIRPRDFVNELWPLAPDKYSPIQANGNSVTAYLFEMPEAFALVLLEKMESAIEWQLAQRLQQNDIDLRNLGEDRVERFLEQAPIDETERLALISARRGQGRFRANVSYVEPICRFTGVANPELLVASHIQPWHRCPTNQARLDPFNGLMLTPTYDRLFDRGLITFGPENQLVISDALPRDDIQRIRMNPHLVTGPFRPQQHSYLKYHRDHVFRAA